jgi:hypothetical protein
MFSECAGIATIWSIPENNLDASPTNHGVGNLANVSISESKIFYATCTDQGVTSDKSDILVVAFSPNPQINSTPNPAAIWEGESIELFARACRPGDTYLWDDNLAAQTLSQTEMQDVYHIAKCVNSTCTTNGTEFFVRVCPILQTFVSPTNDFANTPQIQPHSSQVIIASY